MLGVRTFVPVLFLFACSAPSGGNDAGNPTSNDAATHATDAGEVLLPATTSGVTAALCTSAIDVNAQGALSGETTTVTGHTTTSPDLRPAPCNQAVLGHQVFRYTVRGDNVALDATTAVAGGTDLLDTVLWAVVAPCSADATVLACNDDDPNTPDALGGRSTLHTRSFARGTEVDFVVAAYARVRRGAVSSGSYPLAVTERPSSAAGATCDSSLPGACVSGYECASTSPTAGRCVTPTSETEPNNTPATATPIGMLTSTPMAVHAALMPAGDVDCFAVQVAEGAGLYAEASDGAGGCDADLRMQIYRAGETDSFDGDDDSGRMTSVACPRVSPSENGSLAHLAAGTYTVCVRASESDSMPPAVTLAQYSLQLVAQ